MFERELKAYWETVVDTIQDGIMIVDNRGTIVSVNKAFENITGYTQRDLLGSRCTMLNCNACDIARGKDSKQWCRLFREGKLNMKRCLIQKSNGQYVHVLKNAAVLYDENNKAIGGVETFTDITELLEKDSQIEACRRELQSSDGFYGILGASSVMQQVFDLISNAAQSDAPVIILGESGTGKELVAKAIHAAGPRSHKAFMKVNCAALSESLLESELFGHVKGAFTGAYQDRQGRFEAANGGDIFLDEIGDLPLVTQVKLLRVLEEKVIERVGDNRPIEINVRVITATNQDLKQLVEKGRFRHDLFYRINVIPINIPPLRDRISDIPLLAESFFHRIRLKTNKPIEAITPEALQAMMNYPWPGNVRELKSALEYAFVSCQNEVITPEHLPPEISTGTQPAVETKTYQETKDEVKKQQLIKALQKAKGNQTMTAKLLGVSRVTVWNRIRKYGIEIDKIIKT